MNQYDPRIKNELCIRDPFTIDTGKQYIGKRGYFTDDIFNFSNLDNCFAGMLAHVESDSRHPYYCAISDEGVIIKGNFSFFLSAEFVEEKPAEKPEEKFVPFVHLDELAEAGIEVGKVISIRYKNTEDPVTYVLVTAINYDTDNYRVIDITLGATRYKLSDLFDTYLLQVNGAWKPFGVEG